MADSPAGGGLLSERTVFVCVHHKNKDKVTQIKFLVRSWFIRYKFNFQQLNVFNVERAEASQGGT